MNIATQTAITAAVIATNSNTSASTCGTGPVPSMLKPIVGGLLVVMLLAAIYGAWRANYSRWESSCGWALGAGLAYVSAVTFLLAAWWAFFS